MQQPKSGAYKASPCWQLFCSSCLDSKASKRALRQWDNFMFMVPAPCWAPLVFCEQDVLAVMSLLASPRPIAFPWPEGWAAVPSPGGICFYRMHLLSLLRGPSLPTLSSAMGFLQDAKWWPSLGTTQVSTSWDFTPAEACLGPC